MKKITDKERMDWLQKHMHVISYSGRGFYSCGKDHSTLRKAIDYAMKFKRKAAK